jgi:hypothetical protein
MSPRPGPFIERRVEPYKRYPRPTRGDLPRSPGRLDGKAPPTPGGAFLCVAVDSAACGRMAPGRARQCRWWPQEPNCARLPINSEGFRTIQDHPNDLPTGQRHSRERSMPLLEQEDTMNTITEFTIASVAVAFLVAVAVLF